MADYLNIVYDNQSHPETLYPKQLAQYLFERFGMKSGQKLLEPGCGRGEFLNGFQKLGMQCYGLDLSPETGLMIEGVEVKQANLDNEPLPFENDYFDFNYHKSLLEHLWHPDHFVKESLRILNPRGCY